MCHLAGQLIQQSLPLRTGMLLRQHGKPLGQRYPRLQQRCQLADNVDFTGQAPLLARNGPALKFEQPDITFIQMLYDLGTFRRPAQPLARDTLFVDTVPLP